MYTASALIAHPENLENTQCIEPVAKVHFAKLARTPTRLHFFRNIFNPVALGALSYCTFSCRRDCISFKNLP